MKRASMLMSALTASAVAGQQLQALVWNETGVVCDGCPASVGAMLQDTPGYDINVTYVGPDQDTQLSDDILANADIFAYPGGPDVGKAWKSLGPHAESLRAFVRNGGAYIGICLGAYLASAGTSWAPGDGLNLLPDNDTTGEETSSPGSQVTNSSLQTVIDVDWTWGSGPNAGKTVNNRTLFFQDGDVIFPIKSTSLHVLGRYSANGDIAVTVSPYGQGWVGISGVHLDADESWYTAANFTNPQGVNLEFGYDLVVTTIQGPNSTSNQISTASSDTTHSRTRQSSQMATASISPKSSVAARVVDSSSLTSLCFLTAIFIIGLVYT